MFKTKIITLVSRYWVAVAFVLAAYTVGATNYFGGLLNFPLGSAALSQSGGVLIVSGLDAGGSNGLAIALGPGGRGWRGDFDGPMTLMEGEGIAGSTEYYPTPTLDARTDISVPYSPSEPGLKIEAVTDCYVCPRKPEKQPPIPMGEMKLVLFDAMDRMVDSIHLEHGVPLHLPLCTSNQTIALAASSFLDYGYGEAAWHYYFSQGLCLKPPAGKSYPLITHLAVQYSGLPEDEGLLSPLSGASRTIKLLPRRIAGLPAAGQVRLSAEYLQQFGHLHQALGQAQFDARPDALALNNLGSGGGDGLAIHLGPNNNRLKVRWDGLDPAEAVPPGASFTMAARGSFTGGVKQMLGSMKIQKLATGMVLVNDFTSIGSQSALILVMRDGAQVASFRLNHNTPLSFTGGWPRGGTVGPRLTDFSPPSGPICFYEDWPIDVAIPIAGGSVMGNQIRVLIDDVPGPFASLDAVQFTLAGLPQFVLTGEESSDAGVVFDGLVHTPLGNATLHADAVSERLTISGIGSSGNDGVRILTGGGGGASTKLGVFNPDLLPIDAFLHWAAIDPTDAKVQELTVQRVAGGGALFADFTGLGAPAVTVALYSNDVLLAYAKGVLPTAPILTFGGGLPLSLNPCILHPEDCYGAIDIEIWQPDPIGPIASLVTLPGNAAMRGTHVLIQPDPLPVVAPAAIHVKEIQLTGKNLGMMSLGAGFSVGVHFGANEPAPGGSALAPGDVAGAVPQANWNNAMGASGSASALVGDLNGAAVPTTITVEWASPNTWSSTGRGEENNAFPPGGDRRLMSGYLDTDNGAGVARVAVFGIDPITANSGYDVIVYILGGVSGRGGAYTIGGVTKYGTAAANPSAHFEDPGVDLNDTGTYVRFTGLTGSSFTLIADANNANGPYRNFRAPINGIQIVRSSNSPPEGLVYFGLEHHVLGQAQYRFDTPGTFTVDNLGISGNDGVEVQIQRLVQSSAPGGSIIALGPPRNAYFADWVALNPQPLPPDRIGELNMRAVGDWNGQPGTTIGSLSVRSAGPGMQLIPDFSAVGASRQRVELLNGCTLVSTFTVGNGVPAVQMTDAVTGTSLSSEPGDEPCGTMPLPPFPRPWWWSVEWSQPVDVVSPSGQHFQVDRVRLAPEDVTGSLAALSQISYRSIGYSGLRFTRESAERRGLNFNGNQHFPLGQATLTKTAAGTLVMDNVGPSGRDGMEITLGQADYCEVASPSLPLPPPQNSCRYEYHAVLDGIPDRTAAVLMMTVNAAGEMQFTGDMSPLGATRYTVLALDGGQEVAGASNQPVASVAINGASLGYATSLRWDIQRYKCFIRIKVPKLPGNPGPLIRLAPGLVVNGDSVLLLPEDPTRAFGPQNRLLLTAVAIHPEPKLFVNEQLGMFGLGHTGLGDATLDAAGGTLTVGNLGISGNNGVAIELEPSCNFLAGFAQIQVPAVQSSGSAPWIQARAFGYFGGLPNHDLGALRFTAIGNVVQVDADFTPVGSSTHTIEVWRGGQLVQRVPGHTGVAATVGRMPVGLGKLGGADPSVLPCFIAPFGAIVPITIGGGATIDGDELRVLTGNPTAAIGELQSLQLQASGFVSFTLANETLTPALPPPVIHCPENIVRESCLACVPVNYSAPEVLNGALISCLPPSGTCFPQGVTTVTCTGSNACGRSQCQFTITVRRPAPPVLQCPTNPIVVTLPCLSNCVPVSYPMPAVLNGALVSCTPPPGTCLPAGIHSIVCRATNQCSEAECVFTVRVEPESSEPPAIHCPPDIFVPTCGFGELVNYPAPVVTGADPGSLVCTPPSGSFFPVGTNKVVCCVTDRCGRKACCEFLVIVPKGLNFAGNPHCPLGLATLTRDTVANTLALGNLTGSGLDGMEIALGQADFLEVASPLMAAPGDSCRYEYRAVVDGINDRPAAILTMADTATGDMQFIGDMSPLGATRYTLQVLDGEMQVGSVSNQPNATFTMSGNAVYVAPSLRWEIKTYKCYIRIKLPKIPGDPGPLIRLAPGLAVNGDSVIVLPENPSHTLGAQNRLLLTATTVRPQPKLFISEALGMFGRGHTGLGDATLTANGGTLTVGNLGVSGNDGVAIDLESSINFLASFMPFDPSAVQGPYPHPWLQAHAFGRFNALPNHDLGSVRFTVLSPTAVEVVADFTPVGATTHTIEVWRSGQLVQRLTGLTGPIGTVNAWPTGIGKLGGAPGTQSCIWAVFHEVVQVNVTGGPTLDGDELRILVENPSAAIGELQSFRLQSAGLGSFTLVNEMRTPALAPPRVEIGQVAGGRLQLTIPTAFGYSYTLESVNALGPHPWPWSEVQTFAGNGSILTIPLENPGTMNQFYRVRIEDPFGPAGGGPLPDFIFPHKIFLTLDNVIVDEARDPQRGDRPYFVTILFQSQFNTPASTTVQLRESEPHDWVSKDEYNGNGTLLKGKDRMLPQDSLPIPEWMGGFEWDDVQWKIPQDLVTEFLQDPLNFKPQIMILGAAVLALDNRNTPPHMIRGLLNQVADGVKSQLTAQVESGSILQNLNLLNQQQALTDLQARFNQLGRDVLAQLKVDAVALVVGSLLDPDVPVGASILVFPTIPGIQPITASDSVPLLGSTISLDSLIRTPEPSSPVLSFRGMNAVYRVNARVVPDFVPPPPPPQNQPDPTLVDVVTVFTQTGEDDLRGSSAAMAEIRIKGRSPETFRLNDPNQGFDKRSPHMRSFVLSSPAPYGDLESITLRVVQGSCFGCTSDNWDVQFLDVKCTGSILKTKPLFSKGGTPLVRLVEKDEHPENNEFREKTFPFNH